MPLSARVFSDAPTGAAATVPDAVTPYERRVLQLEFQRLVRELDEMRERIRAEAPELAPQREAFAAAQAAGDVIAAEKARREIVAESETLLRESPEGAAKIKRLGDVGSLLEKDKRPRKEIRSLSHERPAPRPAE